MELGMPQWGPSLNSQYIFRYLQNAVAHGALLVFLNPFSLFFAFHKSGSSNLSDIPSFWCFFWFSVSVMSLFLHMPYSSPLQCTNTSCCPQTSVSISFPLTSTNTGPFLSHHLLQIPAPILSLQLPWFFGNITTWHFGTTSSCLQDETSREGKVN